MQELAKLFLIIEVAVTFGRVSKRSLILVNMYRSRREDAALLMVEYLGDAVSPFTVEYGF